jgi:catechol 2,3-dioxygenase-like lactoylglutathione lyase family enzyme
MHEDAVKPSHLGLCVADLQQSLRFYCEGLGFEAAEVYDLDERMLDGLDRALEVSSPVKLRSQMIKNGELKIELLHYTEPEATGSPSTSRGQIGFTHVSFFVADVDRVAAKLAKLGGTILDTTRSQLGYEVVFVADPDGARVELMAPPRT